MEQHLFEGQTCLRIVITIYCNAAATGWSPVTEINEGRSVIVFISFWEMLRFPSAKKWIFPQFWHTTPHMNWSLLMLWEGLLTVPSGGQTSDDHLCDAALTQIFHLLLFFVDYKICVWTLGYLNSQAGTDQTGVILPHSSSSSKNDKWKYSGLLIACFYGITSLQQVTL